MSRYGTRLDLSTQALVEVAQQRGHEVERLRLALADAERERDEARAKVPILWLSSTQVQEAANPENGWKELPFKLKAEGYFDLPVFLKAEPQVATPRT
jgi:hypothetical protein